MIAASRCERGQASVEWTALCAVVALALAALVAAGPGLPGTGLAQAIGKRLLCAARLGSSCGGPGELTIAYGSEVGALVERHAPLVAYEPGMRDLPVDFRECVERACAEAAARGRVSSSDRDEPVTAFTRVVDCRGGAPGGKSCPGSAAGALYIQYWFYYPDSYTAPWPRSQSFHDNDWESYQVRIGADGAASARASAHHGYDYDGSGLQEWANEAGRVPLVGVPLPKTGAWGPERGTLWVSADSHAGRVVPAPFDRGTPRRKLWLIPLEEIAAGDYATYDFGEITAPWRKAVWTDPESKDT